MTLTVSTVAGIVATFVTAVATRAHWSSTVTRVVSLFVYVVLAGVSWFATTSPETWNAAVSQLAVVVAAGQVAYTALKPSGILDWVEEFTTPVSDRRAKHEADTGE